MRECWYDYFAAKQILDDRVATIKLSATSSFFFNNPIMNFVRNKCGWKAAQTLSQNGTKLEEHYFETLYLYEYKMSIKSRFHHWTSEAPASVTVAEELDRP